MTNQVSKTPGEYDPEFVKHLRGFPPPRRWATIVTTENGEVYAYDENGCAVRVEVGDDGSVVLSDEPDV